MYRYYFLRRNYDVERICAALKLLEGEHDFRNFCRIDAVNVCDFTRVIFRGDVVEIEKGFAFLASFPVEILLSMIYLLSKSSEDPFCGIRSVKVVCFTSRFAVS